MLRRGEKATIQVDTVYPFGVFCHVVTDGLRGYIRRRELTLQGTLDPRSVVHIDDLLDVVVLQLATDERIIEFSRRKALPDPWIEFGHKTRMQDVVQGTVKYVSKDWVIVEVQPGVDGIIALEDLSIERVKRPEDVVWPGDRVEATVLRIDPNNHKLQLSIKYYLERGLLISRLLNQMNEQDKEPPALSFEPKEDIPESRTPLHYTGHILVAEDNPEVRTALTLWLESEGCQVKACSNGSEALEYFDHQVYSLLLTDINMPVVDGIALVRQIRRKYPKTVCVFLSDPDHISQNLSEIEKLGGYIFTKPLDTEEIHQFLADLSDGVLPARLILPSNEENQPFRPFGEKVNGMRSIAPLIDRINLALAHLLEETEAEKVVLFHYNPIKRLINIQAEVGTLQLDVTQVNSLVASPVEDVITEDFIIWENHISSGFSDRYENLLRLLPFQSCIGLPVQVGEEHNHALFIFHRQSDVFNRYRVRDVQTAASLISVALEEDLFRHHVSNSSALLLNGQLSSAFNHEIYNKISVLDFQLDMLSSSFKSLQDTIPDMRNNIQAEQVNKSLAEVSQAVRAINRMAEDFRHIMRGGSSQLININQIIQQACEQIKPAVARGEIVLTTDLDASMPDLRLNRFALIYIVYNLMINAIQHLENRPGERLLKVQTGRTQVNGYRYFFIRVVDNGPGIHCQLWEKIFELGYTSRQGGSGLGLYIARSLVETLGGKIFVEESFILAGTVLRIEIPEEAASE